MKSDQSFVLVLLVVLVQAIQIECESTESVPATKITHTDREYIGKYLPEMWMALKRANIDDVHLLRMKKLEVPAKSLNDTVKSCIVKYLQAIKPVAFVKLSAESNESCSVRVVQQHADILRMASRKGFRCLKLYKIGISNVYSDAPQLSEDDQKALDITFTNCLTELETKATTDMELLNGRVVDCTNEMAGIGTSTLETNDETNTDITEASTSTDDDTENQIEIVGAQNVSSLTS